ncbi:MAG TPA: adenylate kinase [Rubrobacteraceae bacterium]|jgi:adenylate kinase|nr:adenylate kinase [Rubrobacteraceae bacterium]
MRIVLLGPQGAGKGTQAQRISRETGAKHISTGDLVRAEIKSGSELGQTIKDYNDRGDLVPDEIIIEMMKPYLDEADSWILDGFPRNESQAEALDKMLTEIDAELDAAVALEAPDDLLVERLSGRRTSEATGNIYHVEYDPPPEDSEEDPGPFVQREDDTEESIRRRLEVYHEQTEPLKGYYADRGILAQVDATQGISEVTDDILESVEKSP